MKHDLDILTRPFAFITALPHGDDKAWENERKRLIQHASEPEYAEKWVEFRAQPETDTADLLSTLERLSSGRRLTTISAHGSIQPEETDGEQIARLQLGPNKREWDSWVPIEVVLRHVHSDYVFLSSCSVGQMLSSMPASGLRTGQVIFSFCKAALPITSFDLALHLAKQLEAGMVDLSIEGMNMRQVEALRRWGFLVHRVGDSS